MNLIQINAAYMSFAGAVIILVILVIRSLALHRLPKNLFLILWKIALIRLLIPYYLPFDFSIYSLSNKLFNKTNLFSTSKLFEANEAANNLPAIRRAMTVPGGVPISSAPELPAQLQNQGMADADILLIIWLAGTLVCAVFFISNYIVCRRKFSESLPLNNEYTEQWLDGHRLRIRSIEIRRYDRISAPLTYGVLHPVILMPKAAECISADSLEYVLEHEYVHIRRFDAALKLVLTAALCIHWFNPLVWVMYIIANRDIELSCDEAVINRLSDKCGTCPGTKSAYAMTLISMEEAKIGLTPFCNNFSKNSIEERIIAIMKMKKTSMAALLAAAGIIVGVTSAFATSAANPEDTQASGISQAAESLKQDFTLTSYTDSKDGKTYYTIYDGENPRTMSADEFESEYPSSLFEWWTADEFSEWLENEKKDLKSAVGGKYWTPSTGWREWTQEEVDRAIAQYEQTLEDIKNGLKVSKPIVSEYGTDDAVAITMYGFNDDYAVSAEAKDYMAEDAYSREYEKELLSEYKKFGLTYDEEKNTMYFNGKLVRYFNDGVDIENGTISVYDYINESGVVDVYTVREATLNDDGSTNPTGRLIDIKEYSKEEFDKRDISAILTPGEAVTYVVTTNEMKSDAGISFEERFAVYSDYGITYEEAAGVSGKGTVYYNGEPVNFFADLTPSGSVFTYNSSKGSINVRTVYDENGILTGVKPFEF